MEKSNESLSSTDGMVSVSLSRKIVMKIKWKRLLVRLKKNKGLYLMLIPFIAYYLLFAYKPLYGMQIAFKDYSLFKGIAGSDWSGFDNFKVFFQSPYFFRTLKNTLLISLYGLVFAFPVPVLLALLLNEVRGVLFKKSIQTMTYMPHFISTVVIAGIVTQFLAPGNGLINIIIEKLGFEKIYFLVRPEYFRTIYISMGIWKEAGFSAIVYLAALSGINSELYEAAVIDGANRWKQTWNVTIPGIMPTVIILFILRLGDILEVGHETIILLYQPSTYETADVFSTYVYRIGLEQANFGLATAVGLFNSVVGLILVVIANKISKKATDTSLW